MAAVVAEAARAWKVEGKKVLLVIPDNTRTCPIGLLLREAAKSIGARAAKMDVLIALGTHAPMEHGAILRFLGMEEEEFGRLFAKTRFFNHAWNDPASLTELGRVSAEKMAELSEGRMRESFPVLVNRLVFDYDQLIVIGPTFPHEVVGFSGGNKYFFPGIAGGETIDAFHWLGALITNREIIGTPYTPVRAVVDHCASLIPRQKFCLSLVVTSKGLHGLYAGAPEAAYREAARLSAQVNVRWFDRPFKTVLSICPPMYPELWTAGKCMYKLEPVIAVGGTLIIYGPHLRTISKSHGPLIERIGYHCLPYFTAQMERFADIPGGILAHSTHVKGAGRYENGVETPNVNVILATGIPEEVCRRINLGYLDPAAVDPKDYADREDEGILLVPKAGEVLYKLKA